MPSVVSSQPQKTLTTTITEHYYGTNATTLAHHLTRAGDNHIFDDLPRPSPKNLTKHPPPPPGSTSAPCPPVRPGAAPQKQKTKKDHPYSKFCWGNLYSLRDEPLSKGVDVRQELIDFHAKHYRAPAMQLVVLGGQSLDELQALVVSSFSGVACGGGGVGDGGGGLPEEAAALAAAGLPFDAGALGRVFRVQPVKDVHRLHVTWQLRENHRWGIRRDLRVCVCMCVCIVLCMLRVVCMFWRCQAAVVVW